MERWVEWMQSAKQQAMAPREGVDGEASWFLLWTRTAALGLLLLLLFFGGYELLERHALAEAPPALLHRLHLARGLSGALLLGTWAFLSIRKARLERDAALQARHDAQLRHQEKMASLGLMAAGFAHDLGNPLASIASELEMLEGEEDGEQIRASLAVLRRHIDRINRTLREMTDFARRRREEITDVSVELAVHDSLRLLRHDPRWKRVQVELQLDPAAPSVRMVEDHLVLALINLMLNAADAMPGGGVLRITSAKRRDGVEILVSDTGTGMPPEVLRNALKPLFTTKEHHRGTGLGLSVSSDVVRAVGGTLDLDSQPGAGTQVRIWLPGALHQEEPPCLNGS
jgi:signal transduction histidine kinase